MNRFAIVALLFTLGLIWLGGCALTPEQRSNLEKVLKQEVDSFTDDAVQGHWDQAYAMVNNGAFQNVDQFKANLAKSQPDGSSLISGEVVSMAWEDDKTAKVKINWQFRQGNTTGFSSETYVWVLKSAVWKYQGRALR